MDKTTQNGKSLSDKQNTFLTHLLTSKSITEACKHTKISRATYYSWVKEPDFRNQIIEKRNELVNEAFGALKSAFIKAVENLIVLMDDPNPSIQRQACKDIIEYSIKAIEMQDIEERLSKLEEYAKTKSN